MTKMMVVDKQFLADIYGISYAIRYDYNSHKYVIDEVFTYPAREMYPTVEEAYAALVAKITNENKQKIADFESLRKTFKGRVKMIKYSLGMLPAKNMKYLANKLEEIEQCVHAKNIPAMDNLLKPLEDKFLISESFIRPNQKLYAFVKAHSSHFDSSVYVADTYLVGAEVYRTDGQLPRIAMKVDLHTQGATYEETKHFRIDWDDFKRFNDDYLTTDITGEFIFSDKEKCLAFAREMLSKDIQKIQNNIDALTL